MADRWPTRTSLGYNCEVASANPACRKRRLLGKRVGYVLVLPFEHGCLGTAFMVPAHLAMAPNLNLT